MVSVELPIKAKKEKLNISSIPSFERKRIAGKNVNEFKDGLLILIKMIKLFLNNLLISKFIFIQFYINYSVK